jgi:tetratricopeptide (TPR) repeat protein
MRIHFRKTESLTFVGGALLLFGLPLLAQQTPTAPASPDTSAMQGTSAAGGTSTPPLAPGAAPVSGLPASQPGTTGTADSSTSSALDYMFNHKPQDGTVAKEGMAANEQAKTQALAEDALDNQQIEDPDLRAQFETYLAMNEVPQDQLKAYGNDMNNVIDLLHQKKTTEAWQQLYQLAKYQTIDAGVSWELANRIESIWNADQTKDHIAQQNNQLQQQSDTDNRNADMDSDDIKDKEIDFARRLHNADPAVSKSPNGGVPQAPSTNDNSPTMTAPESDQLLGKLQLTKEYLDSLEAQGKIKLNELKVDKLFDQAKQDFADYITTLYKSGRYQHVLIAADFWRQIFDEGDYPVSMAQQVNASLEVIGQVNTTIGVFNNNLAQNNIAAASNNLQQAYVASNFSPSVLGVPLASKKPILVFSRDLSRMRNMIEARDFTDLESILAEIKKTAPDFDAVKAMSIVNGVKLESQLDLGKAKLAAQQGDLKSAMEDFQQAAEAWPENPDLKDKALSFFNSEDDKTQSLDEFDRLVAENNYRGIYDKQLMFAPAMKDDPKRQDELKAALGKVKIAETATEKATLMEANGDFDGAWETVQLAIKDLPEDVKLNSLRGDLAAKGAEFVSAISKAQDAEAKQELGYSLSWYAVAQRLYPASQIANQAIDRISKAILAKSGV